MFIRLTALLGLGWRERWEITHTHTNQPPPPMLVHSGTRRHYQRTIYPSIHTSMDPMCIFMRLATINCSSPKTTMMVKPIVKPTRYRELQKKRCGKEIQPLVKLYYINFAFSAMDNLVFGMCGAQNWFDSPGQSRVYARYTHKILDHGCYLTVRLRTKRDWLDCLHVWYLCTHTVHPIRLSPLL